MATPKKNDTVKAFTTWLSKHYRTEWEMVANTNPNRGKVYDQWEFHRMFDRYGENVDGCSKAVHKLQYIVVKRHQYNGYIPEIRNSRGTGNQLIDEINCWLTYWDKPESDLLCPVLKYFTSKSDKVSATSDTMQENVVIIAQKAIAVGNAKAMCRKAYELNGYKGESPDERFARLERLSDENNWRDALYNGGNSGVIYDYRTNRYKAVFIDYAL